MLYDPFFMVIIELLFIEVVPRRFAVVSEY
jgi:hypothetical protein